MGKGDTLESAPPATAYRSVMEEYGYEVGKVIGNGSYGTVYEAYYTKQKVMVAVKIISKKKASEDYLNKFLPREIQVGKGARRGNRYQAAQGFPEGVWLGAGGVNRMTQRAASKMT